MLALRTVTYCTENEETPSTAVRRTVPIMLKSIEKIKGLGVYQSYSKPAEAQESERLVGVELRRLPLGQTTEHKPSC